MVDNKKNQSKQDYDPSKIEPKWQEVWNQSKVYSPNLDEAKKLFYNLMMFPYPSAEGMHVGNMYAFTGADVYGRFMRMQGFDVFEPIGLDGFGIHSENYAIRVGRHPKEQAKISEANFYRQLRATGNGFDWSRKLETYDPKYYKWTQWLFIQLFKAGLAYRAKAKVNWCPSCKTVLADEQVVQKVKGQKSKVSVDLRSVQRSSAKEKTDEVTVNVCERCETEVTKKDLEQWFFRITKYAERLLANLAKLDWSEKVKIAQRQWIGRSEGATIKFSIFNFQFSIEVFTTRPDTLYGATFLVLSPEHPLVAELLKSKVKSQKSKVDEVGKYVENAKKKTEQERVAEGKEKTGVFSGLFAINPLNQEKIPVWIADYVLMGYGTGALFGDAHDKRDVEFAKKYKIPLKPTIMTGDKEKDVRIKNLEDCHTGEGVLFDSGEFSGLTSEEAKKRITAWLKDHNSGGPKITYHLRDWLISRQRYWGPPIPMICCKKCDWQPVPEKDLPVLLPEVKDWMPKGSGKSPLATVESFVNATCPNCKNQAKRETDVSDTFLDSSWYFLRYLGVELDNVPFPSKAFISEHSENSENQKRSDGQNVRKSDLSGTPIRRHSESSEFSEVVQRVDKWLPVSMYIGGAEHSVLHLLYSRFITMVLHDLGYISFQEPFSRFFAHGLLIKEGAKMSKSKGNVVVPDEYIRKFGADSLRMYLMFLGPFSQGGDFYDTGIEGMYRFLNRVWRLIAETTQSNTRKNAEVSVVQRSVPRSSAQFMHKTVKKVTEDIGSLRYNTAIASLMTYYNFLSKQKVVSKEEAEVFLKLLAPFAPHVTEELWEKLRVESGKLKVKFSILNSQFSIHTQPWPTFDPNFLVEDEVTIVIQVNGKVRETIKVESGKLKVESYVQELAKESVKIRKYIEGKSLKKVVYVEGKVINFVVE